MTGQRGDGEVRVVMGVLDIGTTTTDLIGTLRLRDGVMGQEEIDERNIYRKKHKTHLYVMKNNSMTVL